MADAGKIMIMPKGAYDASVSYEILDLVTHNDRVWVAKRTVIGVEPTEENSDDWFMMVDDNVSKLGGKEASEYALIAGEDLSTAILEKALTLSKGTYNFHLVADTGDLPTSMYKYGSATIFVRNKSAILVVVWGIATNTTPIATNYYGGSGWTGWNSYATTADLANKLDKTGGTVEITDATGFGIKRTNGSSVMIPLYNVNDVVVGGFGSVDGKATFRKGTEDYDILHTGNKPSGTYTGNGSATERLIKSAGLGNAVLIWVSGSPDKVTLVTPAGSFAKDSNGITGLQSFSAYVNGGNLRIISTHANLNASGVIYEYQFI